MAKPMIGKMVDGKFKPLAPIYLRRKEDAALREALKQAKEIS